MNKLLCLCAVLVLSCQPAFAQENISPKPVIITSQPGPVPAAATVRVMDRNPFLQGMTAASPFNDVTVLQMNMMTDKLVPPTMLMQNQDKLELTSKQVNQIKNELKAFQSAVVDVQWDLQSAMQKLNEQMDGERIDEQKTLAAMEEVLKHEKDLKTSHLRMLIRIRNTLTGKQLQTLQNLRNTWTPVYMGGPAPQFGPVPVPVQGDADVQ